MPNGTNHCQKTGAWSLLSSGLDKSHRTGSVQAGHNGVGVASIVALINAVKPLKVPYVFGGDGATACFPLSVLDIVKPALVASKKMSLEQFDLKLRVGVVHITEIRGQRVLWGLTDIIYLKYT